MNHYKGIETIDYFVSLAPLRRCSRKIHNSCFLFNALDRVRLHATGYIYVPIIVSHWNTHEHTSPHIGRIYISLTLWPPERINCANFPIQWCYVTELLMNTYFFCLFLRCLSFFFGFSLRRCRESAERFRET